MALGMPTSIVIISFLQAKGFQVLLLLIHQIGFEAPWWILPWNIQDCLYVSHGVGSRTDNSVPDKVI